jgi:hypothetical protein
MVRGFGLALLTVLVSGCAEELGPERFRTTTIHGQVTLAGRPLGPGWLEIMPTEGTTGLLRSAQVATDGTFRADRVPVGVVAMRMVGFPAVGTGVPSYDRFLQEVRQIYLIRRPIPPTGGEVPMDLSQDVQNRLASTP